MPLGSYGGPGGRVGPLGDDLDPARGFGLLIGGDTGEGHLLPGAGRDPGRGQEREGGGSIPTVEELRGRNG